MISFRRLTMILAVLGLSACAAVNEPASRGATSGTPSLAPVSPASVSPADAATAYLVAQYDVEEIRVTVPRSLKVSEANTFKPRADIVWRGEARGDRHAQVAAIFQEAMTTGTAAMQKGRKVDIEVEVIRFHALTEKTRYTIGGVHEMTFRLSVRDATTGEVLDGPREVVADVKASGGATAIAEDQAGRTQRVVIVERLAEVIRRELSAPASEEMIVSRLETAVVLVTE